MTNCAVRSGATTELLQASTYHLVWPVTRDGQEIPGITGGELALYDRAGSLLISKPVSFSVDKQEITVDLDSSDTIDFLGLTRYELWITGANSEPLAVEIGNFNIIKTLTRL